MHNIYHRPAVEPRDYSRRDASRHRAMTRRKQRRAKSAMLFRAIVFPPELAF